MTSRYFYNIAQTVHRILHHPVKKDWHIDFLSSLCYPVQLRNNEFVQFADRLMLIAQHCGQLGVQEHLLNELFSPVAGGIYIEDGSPSNEVYTWNEGESASSETFLFNESETPTLPDTFLFNEGELVPSLAHYIINVPMQVYLVEAQNITNLAMNFRPAGRSFSVIGY